MAKLGRMKLLDVEIPTRFEPSEGITYIAMRPVVEGLGLAWKPQYQKLTANRDYMAIIRELKVRGSDGKHRKTICLPRDYLDRWLLSLDTEKIRPEARRRIELSRRQMANERRAVLEWMARDLRSRLFESDYSDTPLTPIEAGLVEHVIRRTDRSRDDVLFPLAYEAVQEQIAEQLAENDRPPARPEQPHTVRRTG